jgi:ABC-2 type transport system permease protein
MGLFTKKERLHDPIRAKAYKIIGSIPTSVDYQDQRRVGMNSRKIVALVKKDLIQYFASPMGYLVLTVYFFVEGLFFWLIVQNRVASMVPIFQNFNIIFLFLTPMITMRLWSEEEKSGTAELLVTSPLTYWEIILGKYLAVCVFFGAMLSSTFVYLAIIMSTGNPDLGSVAANYAGYILSAMTFFSIGLMCSSLTDNQIVSAVLTFGVLLLLWVIGAAAGNVQGPLGDFLKYFSTFEHLDDFFKGVVDLTHVFYFLSVIFMGLFISVKVLESKRS